MFKKGSYNASFHVNITDDMKVEKNKHFSFSLIIANDLLPPGVVHEEPSQATINVVDNDCEYLILHTYAYVQ